MTTRELIKKLEKLPPDSYVDINPINYGDDAELVIWPSKEIYWQEVINGSNKDDKKLLTISSDFDS